MLLMRRIRSSPLRRKRRLPATDQQAITRLSFAMALIFLKFAVVRSSKKGNAGLVWRCLVLVGCDDVDDDVGADAEVEGSLVENSRLSLKMRALMLRL